MRSNRFAIVMTALLAATALVGCRKKAKAEPEKVPEPAQDAFQEVPPNPLHDLYMAADEKLEAGDKEGATKMMVAALDDAKYAANKAELFTTVIRFMLFTEQIEDAKTRFLNVIRTEPELAMPGFDLIYGHHMRAGDPAATLEWTRQLMLQPLTKDMKRPAMEWLLVALLEAANVDELATKLPAFLDEFPAEDGAQVVQRLCSTAQQAQQYEAIDRIVDAVGTSNKKADPALVIAVTTSRLLSLLGREQWDAVDAAFPAAIASLPDASLQTVFSNVAGAARRSKKPQRLESLADQILKSAAASTKPGARNAAAREWVSAAVEQGQLAVVPSRLGALLALKVPPQQVFSSLSRHFYTLIDHPAVLKDLIVQADVLSPLLEDDASRNALNALMLDGCFVVEDYDRALRLLEKGIADRKPEWHAMAITKVKAHKALKEKNIDEAVKQFRAFMAIVAKSEEDSPDPVSNVVHTRDTILGRNAKRIGDIYAEAGRADESRKAYREAKGYYEAALAANKAGEETEKLIRTELGEIPAGQP